jgi:uncharacterized Fe-S cluster protein YjdI
VVRAHYQQITQDDAFIAHRHARNLVRGDGSVFNRRERVEGCSSFLWVMLAALASLEEQ